MQTSDSLSLTFSALADPTRRAILSRLSQSEASVTELAGPFDMSMPAISKHLKVLERAGLIQRGREAQFRPCKIEGSPLREVADWVDQYRQHWEERLDRLEAYLEELQAAETSREKKKNRQQKRKQTTPSSRARTPRAAAARPSSSTKKTTKPKRTR